jgi:putative membrane protein
MKCLKEKYEKTLIESLYLFIRGFLMGIADIIPGVSGGTIALITGIYEKLIYSISQVNFKFILDFFKKDYKQSKKNFLKIDFLFFIPLVTGIGLAFIIMSGLIEHMLNTKTAITYSFFFGLILASVYFVYKKIKKINYLVILSIIIGFMFTFILIGLGITNVFGHSYPVLFFSGAIAICAMILPGISGAMILLLLGQYEYLLGVIHNFEFGKIFTFMFGALVGILSFSKLLNYLLKKHHDKTIGFLTGLMLGSLRLPYIEINSNIDSIIFVVVSLLIGFFCVISLQYYFKIKTKELNKKI